MTRTVVWFSCGVASAVATKLTLRDTPNATVAYIDPGSEHRDNERFLVDCEQWLSIKIERLKSTKHEDTWDVWKKKRFLASPAGAPCTTELKKKVRYGFQRPDDRQVFGFTVEEASRANRFREQNPGVELITPLITEGLTKNDCIALIRRAGLVIPEMYRLGYHNANCVGCVKGGMGYWNKIRVDFPDVFERMALMERELKHSLFDVYLDELDPTRGNFPTELSGDCSLLCAIVEPDITA